MTHTMVTKNDLNKFSYLNPDFEDRRAVKSHKRAWVPFEEIDSSITDNEARAHGIDTSEFRTLEESILSGIDFTEQLPVLVQMPIKHNNGQLIKYKMNSGFTRMLIFKAIGYTGYLFDIIDPVDLASAKGIGFTTNCGRPRSFASNADAETLICNMIDDKVIPNTETAIVNWLKRWSKFSKGRITTIKNSVIAAKGSSKKRYITWIGSSLPKKIHSLGLEWKGNEDASCEIGFTCYKQYIHDAIGNCMRKFHDVKGTKVPYVVFHTANPTSDNDLIKKRKALKRGFEADEAAFKYCAEVYMKTGQLPWEKRGFLYQDIKDEKHLENTLIPYDSI